MDAPPVHPDMQGLAFLLGTWAGEGVGDYPTIERFRYREESRFDHVGKPYFSYLQRTWSLDAGAPMHSESGFLRSAPGGAVELVLAHPFGVVEIDEGRVEGRSVLLSSRELASTSTAAEVSGITRSLTVDGDVLHYAVDMAAAGRPLQRHLDAELRRFSG